MLALNRLPEAKKYFTEAITICSGLLKVAVGAFQGSLAVVYSRQKDHHAALESIAKGQKLVQGIPIEKGKFLCKKAQVYHAANQPIVATESFTAAKNIAKALQVGPRSTLGNLVFETEKIPFLFPPGRISFLRE